MDKPKILVVEDERIIARNIEDLLSPDFDVLELVVTGEEAVQKSEELKPDLVLMDIVLAGEMDGIEAANQIMERFSIPVVYLTAYFDEKKLKRTMAAAPFGYIIKPFKSKELEVTIRMALIRSKVETKLKESEERYRDLVEKAGIAIITDDEQGNIRYFNEKFAEIFGYSMAEMKELSYDSLVHPDDLNNIRKIHKKRIQNKRIPARFEFRGKKKDGSDIFLEADAVKFKENGAITGTRSYIRDITEQKRMADEIKSSREILRSLAAYLQSVREEERTNISREIHDELGQALTALKMDLFWIKGNLSKKPQMIETKTEEMISLTDTIIKTVKKISSDLRPGLLDDLGLVPAIEWQTQEFQERMQIPCRLKIDSEKMTIEKEESTALFRIFQEALTNIARHAQATNVKVMLDIKKNMVVLKVQDNGTGITKDKVNSPLSLGLVGMMERAKSFGGEVVILGKENEGTSVTVKIPVISGG